MLSNKEFRKTGTHVAFSIPVRAAFLAWVLLAAALLGLGSFVETTRPTTASSRWTTNSAEGIRTVKVHSR